MQKPPILYNEVERLQAVQSLKILDTLPEERFDRITRLASHLFNVPIALISLVDHDRQWLKSRQGLNVCETSRDISFCGHAIIQDGALIVPDTLNDVRFADNPLVTGAPMIRFYAGHPIHAPNGLRVGTLCIIDRQPRELSPQNTAALADLASLVDRELSLVAASMTDELTGLLNRRGFFQMARHILALCHRHSEIATLVSIDLNKFKEINDNMGHAAGDKVLRGFCGMLIKHFRTSEIVGRLGGDEFCVLASAATESQVKGSLERFAKEYTNTELAKTHPDLSWSCGFIEFAVESQTDIDKLILAADRRMYDTKRQSKLHLVKV